MKEDGFDPESLSDTDFFQSFLLSGSPFRVGPDHRE